MPVHVRTARLVLLAIALTWWLPSLAAARVYKWVDEKGQIHVESTPPPIDYEWADPSGFYYNRGQVPGKELSHVRPRPAVAPADPAPGGPRPSGTATPGETSYRRVEGLIAQAERQALAFDEGANRGGSSSASPLDSAWSIWQRGFAAQVEQVEQSVRADAAAPSSLQYALDSLRSLAQAGSYVPARSSRESTIRSARSSLSGARAELDRRSAARSQPAAPAEPSAAPAYPDEMRPRIVAPPMAMPSFAGLQGADPSQLLATAQAASRTATMRQAMVQVVMLGGCEAGLGGTSWTPGTWARHIVEEQNKAQREQAAETRKMMPPGAMSPEPARFVYGAPTAPWQIAVIPDVDRVRVEAYGTDLKSPIQSESLPCAAR